MDDLSLWTINDEFTADLPRKDKTPAFDPAKNSVCCAMEIVYPNSRQDAVNIFFMSWLVITGLTTIITHPLRTILFIVSSNKNSA